VGFAELANPGPPTSSRVVARGLSTVGHRPGPEAPVDRPGEPVDQIGSFLKEGNGAVRPPPGAAWPPGPLGEDSGEEPEMLRPAIDARNSRISRHALGRTLSEARCHERVATWSGAAA
jgi:hypothetical protein